MSRLNLERLPRKKWALVKQLILLSVLVAIVLLIVQWCSGKPKSRFEIENSPIRVEMIRNIAQLANISYKDEVVVDSIEFYKNEQEMFVGSLAKLTDFDNFKHALKASNIKRQITLIVKGEVLIGFDLKDKNFKLKENDSLIQIYMPQPIIIDVLSTASSTKIFKENGKWRDFEIQKLKNKARLKMLHNAEALDLRNKAKENAKRFLSQLIKKNKKIEFIFK